MFSRNNPGMPVINEEIRERMARKQFLVLLGLSDEETDTGLASLTTANLPFHEIKRVHFQGKAWGYTAVLTRLPAGDSTSTPRSESPAAN